MPTHDNDNLMNDLDDFQPVNEPGDDSRDDIPDLVQLDLTEEASKVLTELQSELDQAVAAKQRAMADFRNFQRRAMENERRALTEGAMRVVRSILPVIDHFDLALNQDTEHATTDQIIGGVRMVREELIKALATHGASFIEPKRGDAFDPNRHQAMLHQPDDEIAPDHIVTVLQPGFALGDIVVRPAKVAIAPEGSGGGARDHDDDHFNDDEPGD